MVSYNIRDKLDGDVLDLSMMNLKEVPLKEIGNLPRVRSLDLSSNQIKTLPPNFGSVLQQITKLDLSANKLEALPKSFYQLVNLRHLDLYNNQITDLPESLHHLKSLRFLDLKNNPLNPDLAKVVGTCLSQKECEVAAKKVVSHFNKEKQRVIEEQKLIQKMKDAKIQQEREEAEARRLQNEKKAAKRERKNENSKAKQQQARDQQHRSGSSKSANGNSGYRKESKSSKSSGGCCSLLNVLLFLVMASAAVWCVHIHVEGDYSEAGFKAAVPRLQTNLLKLRNMTAEALQPKNLKQTGTVIMKSVNTTAYKVGAIVQQGAYKTQEHIEVYTGDLTPYTSQVSKYCGIAFGWVKGKTCCMCDWLSRQDWQGMWDVTVTFLINVWTKVKQLWADFISHPQVKSFVASASEYLNYVLKRCQELFYTVITYLGNNGPVWIEMVKETSFNLYTSAKQSIEGIFK